MQSQNRTDRILIAIALAILLLAGSLFYFDNWMWGNRRSRGERIGVLANKTGDVRMKFEGDLKWQKAARGQDLVYNDSIYSGSDSQANLALGESEMTVTENTLVVLRRDDQVNFMNLSYGKLFGRLAKNQKLMIDTGNGKVIELNTSGRAQITVKKNGDKTELQVTSGTAEVTIDGKKQTLDKTSKVTVDKAQPTKVEKIGLQALKPLREEVIYSENPTRVGFQWRYGSDRAPAATEDFKLEFSSTSDFEKLHASKDVKGKLDTSLAVTESLNLYYRVRGPRGEVSQVERVNFVRVRKPVIVKPLPQAKIITPKGENGIVAIEFRRPEHASVLYQVARDADFKEVLANEDTKELLARKELPVGHYFLRARADMGRDHLTAWTDTVPFDVENKIEMLKATETPNSRKYLIPNEVYPPAMYLASPAKVREFLDQKGLLNDFFPFPAESFDQVNLHFESGHKEDLSQNNTAWPKIKLQPGRYIYKYQTAKQGFLPTPWSEPRKFEIAMEPPRRIGYVKYGEPDQKGEREVSWDITPILFARSYDVQIARSPNFDSAIEFKVTNTNPKATVFSGDNYWRARARDGQGHLISEYSSPQKLPQQPVQTLAENRKPQSTEKSTTRVERIREEPFVKSGWWAWLGAGENYVDYRQSVGGRGTLSDKHSKGPSQYLETGYIGGNGWGAVVSAKHTPGEVNIDSDDGTQFRSGYNWTTVSVEGILRKISDFKLADRPIVYGMRVGIQQHQTPFLFLDGNGLLELKSNQMTTASAGLLAEWNRRRWTYYWLMRYQLPLSTKASGSDNFSVTPVFAFDGSIGTSYNLTQQFKAGLFWYGQWHQYNFVYSDTTQTNRGFQSLFYSNLDFRLGFDF